MALRKTDKNKCYWCCNSSIKQKSQDKGIAASSSSSTSSSKAVEMEVDVENLNAALHELGMLSAITESRKQYLKEITTGGSRNKTSSSEVGTDVQFGRTKGHEHRGDVAATAGFCVVHMNSDYVRNFRGSWDCGQESLNLRGPTSGTSLTFKRDACYSHEDRNVVRPRLHRCGLHFHKPYSIPCDAKVRRRGWSWWSRNQDSESSSKSSRDSGLGNRSNPGSPEKGGGGTTPELLPNGLVRSRSLDDIEAIQQVQESTESESSSGVIVNPLYDFLSTSTVTQRNEIESVSQRMEHLHVN